MSLPDYSGVTTVIFDMDGTLIEHTWQLDQITTSLFERFAGRLEPLTHDEFYEVFWAKNEDMWYMMVDGVLDGDTASRYSYVNTLRALGQDTTLADAMLACWHELVLKEAVPFADTLTVLRAVGQRYTTGIVTNGFTMLQRSKINRYHLAEPVNFTLVSEEIGYHKPDLRIFVEALKMAGGARPEQTLYVGDSLISDIQPAQQLGILPVLMNPRDDTQPPPGVAKIRQLSELLALLSIGA